MAPFHREHFTIGTLYTAGNYSSDRTHPPSTAMDCPVM